MLEKAIEALSDYKFDQKYYDALKKRQDHDRNKNKDNEDIINISFAQFKRCCHCCGKKGHHSDKCFKKNQIPKKDWAINKIKDKQNVQTDNSKEEDSQKGWNTTTITKTNNPENLSL